MSKLNTRIRHKIGTPSEWQVANDVSKFIPIKGEIIVYQDNNIDEFKSPRIKIGDGITLVSSLPFVDDEKFAELAEQIGLVADAIPTKISQLDNDEEYIKSIEVKGDGNAVTRVNKDGENIELWKDASFALSSEVEDLSSTVDSNYNESIIALSVDGRVVTYIKGDGSVHTFETQDNDTTYSLATDTVTGLTKLYATTGNAEDGTMTQKAIKTELDKKVGVTMSDSTLVFTI